MQVCTGPALPERTHTIPSPGSIPGPPSPLHLTDTKSIHCVQQLPLGKSPSWNAGRHWACWKVEMHPGVVMLLHPGCQLPCSVQRRQCACARSCPCFLGFGEVSLPPGKQPSCSGEQVPECCLQVAALDRVLLSPP